MAGDYPRAYCETCEEVVGTTGSYRKARAGIRSHRALNGLHHEVEMQSRPPEGER